jgi:beta-barrel assembly-enhancing protease
MRCNRLAFGLALIVLSLFLFSCATTGVPPVAPGNSPGPMAEDEKELWDSADRFEQRVEKSPFLVKNPDIDACLGEIASRLAPSGPFPQNRRPRIRVIRDTSDQAHSFLNGIILVNLGLLFRMENEDQMATILGHEIAHYVNRSTLRQIRERENKETRLRNLALLTLATGILTPLALAIESKAEAWVLASAMGFSREMETEADTYAFNAMVRAGYDPREAAKALSNGEDDGGKRGTVSSAGESHPKLEDRIDHYRQMVSALEAKGMIAPASEPYRCDLVDRTAPFGIDVAEIDLRAGRYRNARAVIERTLRRFPDDGKVRFLMAEVVRKSERGETAERVAEEGYREAIRLDPSLAEPYREVGLLLREKGRLPEAREFLERYLTLKPDAADGPILRGYLRNMEVGAAEKEAK